jgi:hypothetical protein
MFAGKSYRISKERDGAMIQIVPYIETNNPFYTGVDLYNSSHIASGVEIKVFNINPEIDDLHKTDLRRIVYKTLGPHQHWTPNLWPHDKQSRHMLIIDGPEELSVSVAMCAMDGSRIDGFGFAPVIKPQTLGEIIIPMYQPKQLGQWSKTSNPFWKFLGDCPYLRASHIAALQYIIKSIHFDFPNRQDRCLGIYDNCTNTYSSCPGHSGTHIGKPHGYILDTSYYTLETNSTHARGEVTKIWEDVKDPESKLLPVFDCERNYEFWRRLHLIFPETKITVDERIRDYMATQNPEVRKLTRPCAARSRNHHLHPHIVLGETINYGALIK